MAAKEQADESLDALLEFLLESRGFDFTGYKRTTLGRRIGKRMAAVEAESYADYQEFLEVNPQEFAELFDTILINVTDFYRDPPAWEYLAQEIVPQVLQRAEADSIRIQAEVPGVKPEDVKISVEGNVLTISGTKQQTAEERTERVHRYERTYGAFERTFTLPATVDADKIRASYDHGVLTVTLPKVEKAKPRQIQVELQKS